VAMLRRRWRGYSVFINILINIEFVAKQFKKIFSKVSDMKKLAFLISLLASHEYCLAQPFHSHSARAINSVRIHELEDSIVWVRPRPIPAKGIVQDFK
jgi:hypothetical protein